MSHDRGCYCGREKYEYQNCDKQNCLNKLNRDETMKLDESNDFGFSLVSETELKAHEELLRKKIEEQSKVVEKKETELTDKLHGLRDMIMPLLLNLAKDPEKTYILWPDRAAKIKLFIEKINNYVEN